jgi:hypothetical protein
MPSITGILVQWQLDNTPEFIHRPNEKLCKPYFHFLEPAVVGKPTAHSLTPPRVMPLIKYF